MDEARQILLQKIKSLYPKDNGLQYHAERDITCAFVGTTLEFGARGGINLDTIIKATSLKALKSLAQHLQDKKDLHQQWYEYTYPSPQF